MLLRRRSLLAIALCALDVAYLVAFALACDAIAGAASGAGAAPLACGFVLSAAILAFRVRAYVRYAHACREYKWDVFIAQNALSGLPPAPFAPNPLRDTAPHMTAALYSLALVYVSQVSVYLGVAQQLVRGRRHQLLLCVWSATFAANLAGGVMRSSSMLNDWILRARARRRHRQDAAAASGSSDASRLHWLSRDNDEIIAAAAAAASDDEPSSESEEIQPVMRVRGGSSRRARTRPPKPARKNV